MSRQHPYSTHSSQPLAGPSTGSMTASMGVQESKRDKKRREVIERVERHHLEKVAGRDQIYEDLYKDLTQRNQNLSKDPSTCRTLDIPLYLLNLERDALISSIDLHWEYKNDTLQHLYSIEKQKIEDDFKKGRELVRQRLLDGVEERRRKIREDKESVGDVVAETLLEAQIRPRPTRNARTQKRHLYGHSPPQSTRGTPHPTNTTAAPARNPPTNITTTTSTLASTVANADALLATLLSSTTMALSTENIISPLPYSLAVLPAPNPPAGTGGGKTARRAGRGVNNNKDGGGDGGMNGGSGTPFADDAGRGGVNGTGKDGSGVAGGPNGPMTTGGKSSGPNNTTIRVGPAMTGYAKVTGWTPGKSLDELKGLVTCNEMEREGDLASIRGWGRRARGTTRAGGAAAVAA